VIRQAVQFFDKHKGSAMFLGGLVSVTAGATWWLAKGGAVAIITSMTALSDPEVADTLQGLPQYHARTEETLADLVEGQRQVLDNLEALRLASEQVIEWAPEHSQRLTDAVGGCYAGESCIVYFRGRKTQAGASCKLTGARPRLILPSGEEFPVRFENDFSNLDLGQRFETVEAIITVPPFIEPGLVGVVVLTVYAECPFVSDGKMVERETFRLLVEIKER